VVTNTALRSSIVLRYETHLAGGIATGPCSCGETAPGVVIHDAA
jgi:hypothetical protein